MYNCSIIIVCIITLSNMIGNFIIDLIQHLIEYKKYANYASKLKTSISAVLSCNVTYTFIASISISVNFVESIVFH